MLGLLAGKFCGCPPLLYVTVVSPGLSPGLLFSEPGAFVKRLGCTAQRRSEAFGGLPVTTCCALKEARALGGVALVRGVVSASSRLPASSPLLEPTETLAPALRPLLVSGLLTLIG